MNEKSPQNLSSGVCLLAPLLFFSVAMALWDLFALLWRLLPWLAGGTILVWVVWKTVESVFDLREGGEKKRKPVLNLDGSVSSMTFDIPQPGPGRNALPVVPQAGPPVSSGVRKGPWLQTVGEEEAGEEWDDQR